MLNAANNIAESSVDVCLQQHPRILCKNCHATGLERWGDLPKAALVEQAMKAAGLAPGAQAAFDWRQVHT